MNYNYRLEKSNKGGGEGPVDRKGLNVTQGGGGEGQGRIKVREVVTHCLIFST